MSAQLGPWLRPPRLRKPSRRASASASVPHGFELFFDLVFVVAVAQLAQQLVRDHAPAGFAIVCVLFIPAGIAWQGFSFYGDRFDPAPLRCCAWRSPR